MTPAEMADDALAAMAAGTRMTLVRKRGRRAPSKFPRGELLCENCDGNHVYSYDPARVLAWLNAMGLVVDVQAAAEKTDDVGSLIQEEMHTAFALGR